MKGGKTGTGARGGDPARAAREVGPVLVVHKPGESVDALIARARGAVEAAPGLEVLDALAAEVKSHLSMARAQLAAGREARKLAATPGARGALFVEPGSLVAWSRRVEAASLALASARIAWACLADAVEAQS